MTWAEIVANANEPDVPMHVAILAAVGLGALFFHATWWQAAALGAVVILAREIYKVVTRPVWDKADTVRDSLAGVVGLFAGIALAEVLGVPGWLG